MVCPGRVETDFFSHESFKARAHRPETTRTIPIEAVSQAVIEAVERNRFMTYVPRYYGFLVWLARAPAARVRAALAPVDGVPRGLRLCRAAAGDSS